MGLGSALIYVPGCFATTDELVALSEVVARYGGIYISHLRSEGDRFVEAVDELLTIARRAGCGAEIFHLKAAGRANWPKLDTVIATVEAARAAGLPITADMYTYPASSTGLDATMPPWVREGGHRAWVARLQDPAVRARLEREMGAPADAWENRLLNVGAENVLLVELPEPGPAPPGRAPPWPRWPPARRHPRQRGDGSGGGGRQPGRRRLLRHVRGERAPRRSACPGSASARTRRRWRRRASSCSGVHPRAYGTFARLLGRYVRDEGLIPLEEAVRRLAALPAANLKLDRRGLLRPGYFADVVVFDPGRRPGPRHVRAAPPVRHRHAPRAGERHGRAARRRAHRRHAGARRPRPGEEDLSFSRP